MQECFLVARVSREEPAKHSGISKRSQSGVTVQVSPGQQTVQTAFPRPRELTEPHSCDISDYTKYSHDAI